MWPAVRSGSGIMTAETFFCSELLNKKSLSLMNVLLCHRMFFLLIGLINAAIN